MAAMGNGRRSSFSGQVPAKMATGGSGFKSQKRPEIDPTQPETCCFFHDHYTVRRCFSVNASSTATFPRSRRRLRMFEFRHSGTKSFSNLCKIEKSSGFSVFVFSCEICATPTCSSPVGHAQQPDWILKDQNRDLTRSDSSILRAQ
ncbi:hypothetical protein MRB53_019196 [Persea americana]|uniref:Uncharacterized protein n=1 Tax=Persea americana TaxID=3435 RepID=A0ACC2KYL5_PERAE|nr:hypothetical protein MRB53_019196 [Persea americana]